MVRDDQIDNKIHPKCLGKKCGSWKMCSNANCLKYGCIHYDEEAEDMEIDDELNNMKTE